MHKLSLDKLRMHVDAVLVEMVKNRDVKWDDNGEPIAKLKTCGQDAECSWVFYEVDMSAIGMPVDTPLIAHSYEGEAVLEWNIGPTPLAKTGKSVPPKEAADTLNMDRLLDAFQRFVVAESVLFPTSLTPPRESGAVFIDQEDGSCRACSGVLEVTGVDDCMMNVECLDCGGSYEVEHDAFEGSRDYVLEFLSRRGFDAEK